MFEDDLDSTKILSINDDGQEPDSLEEPLTKNFDNPDNEFDKDETSGNDAKL